MNASWQVHDGRGNGTSNQVRVDCPYEGPIAILASSDAGVVRAHQMAAVPAMLEALHAVRLQTRDWSQAEIRQMGMETTLQLVDEAIKASQPVNQPREQT